jgi:hypothetical protein
MPRDLAMVLPPSPCGFSSRILELSGMALACSEAGGLALTANLNF